MDFNKSGWVSQSKNRLKPNQLQARRNGKILVVYFTQVAFVFSPNFPLLHHRINWHSAEKLNLSRRFFFAKFGEKSYFDTNGKTVETRKLSHVFKFFQDICVIHFSPFLLSPVHLATARLHSWPSRDANICFALNGALWVKLLLLDARGHHSTSKTMNLSGYGNALCRHYWYPLGADARTCDTEDYSLGIRKAKT
jgi:hypothetical protein